MMAWGEKNKKILYVVNVIYHVIWISSFILFRPNKFKIHIMWLNIIYFWYWVIFPTHAWSESLSQCFMNSIAVKDNYNTKKYINQWLKQNNFCCPKLISSKNYSGLSKVCCDQETLYFLDELFSLRDSLGKATNLNITITE